MKTNTDRNRDRGDDHRHKTNIGMNTDENTVMKTDKKQTRT